MSGDSQPGPRCFDLRLELNTQLIGAIASPAGHRQMQHELHQVEDRKNSYTKLQPQKRPMRSKAALTRASSGSREIAAE